MIGSIVENNPANMASVAQFHVDYSAGTLPAVSWVDQDVGLASEVGGRAPAPLHELGGRVVKRQNQDEENGALALGENFVADVVTSVLNSPLWPRILLVWCYDEHGGNYDHVPPPPAIQPDAIPANLGGGLTAPYDSYGVRVPAVVVSGYARRHAVSNVVCDHTSILATIEAKWNLPAMTYRDANAATIADFLDSGVRFPEPPTLAAPSDLLSSEQSCTEQPPDYPVSPR